MATYRHGTVEVGTSTVLLVTTAFSGGVLVQNSGSVPVFIGGETVTADTSGTGGISIAADATVTVPTVGGVVADLYAVVASGTASVTWLAPD